MVHYDYDDGPNAWAGMDKVQKVYDNNAWLRPLYRLWYRRLDGMLFAPRIKYLPMDIWALVPCRKDSGTWYVIYTAIADKVWLPS